MNQTTRSTTSSYPLQQSRSTTAGPLHEVHYRSGSTTANRRQREDVWSSAVSADRAAGGVGSTSKTPSRLVCRRTGVPARNPRARRQREDVWSSAVSADWAAGGEWRDPALVELDKNATVRGGFRSYFKIAIRLILYSWLPHARGFTGDILALAELCDVSSPCAGVHQTTSRLS